MESVSRRRLLGWAGSGLALALAGCSDEDDPEPGLHATTATVLHHPNDRRYAYPEDAAVRAVVENTAADRLTGTLVVTLRPAGDETTSGESWREERAVDLAGGTTRSYFVVFEAVAESGDDEFEATATIRTGG